MNFFKTIIKKIKSKDKELEGMYVVIDDLGNIVDFSKSQKEIEEISRDYVDNIFANGVLPHINIRRIRLTNIKLRKKLRNYL